MTIRRKLHVFPAALIAVVGLATSAGAAPLESLIHDLQGIFATSVSRSGVDYRALSMDRAELERVAAAFETASVRGASREDEIAFWINAYNFFTIRAVVENYPTSSPQGIAGFFDRRKHRVAGRSLTLDEIEEVVVDDLEEPRAHYVLVCAAASCPPLRVAPYRGEELEGALQAREQLVLRDTDFVQVSADGKNVRLSRIFDWYEDDFARNGTLRDYLVSRTNYEIADDARFTFREYDWSLNDAATTSGNAQPYTPTALLVPGETELIAFHNVYTQTSFFDSDGNERDAGGRSTFYTGSFSFRSGWRPRINLGLDLTLKFVHDETFRRSEEPFFRDNRRVALTAIAPTLQFVPNPNWPRVSVETAIHLPLGDNFDGFDEGRRQWPFLDFGDFVWRTEVYYDRPLGRDFLAFLRGGSFLRFDSKEAQLTTPLTAILNYYPRAGWTLYGLGEFSPDWVGDASGNYFVQTGLGLKYLVHAGLELELSTTSFVAGQNSGAGATYNLGFRILR